MTEDAKRSGLKLPIFSKNIELLIQLSDKPLAQKSLRITIALCKPLMREIMPKFEIGPTIRHEQQTVSCMIAIYCRQQHGGKRQLCADCAALQKYALRRLEQCRYGEAKTSCELCPTHCYRSEYRQQIKAVMRYAGPRMLLHHPIRALRYLYKNLTYKTPKV